MNTAEEYDVILIDMGSVFAAAWHSSANDSVSAARERSVRQIRSLVNGHKRAAVCCDSRSNWRKDLAPSYKEQREPKPAAYFEEMARTEEALRRDGLLIWRCEGFEADDVIATAAEAAIDREQSVLVHSSDKDLLQLVRDPRDAAPGVVVCSVRDGRTYREGDVQSKFGVRPSQMRDWLALVGDSSDNIEGVRGVGPKRASEMLGKFGSVEGVLTALDSPRRKEVGGPAVLAALAESCGKLALAQKLVTLRTDAPLEFTEILDERAVAPLVEVTTETDEMMMTVDDDESDLDEVFGNGEENTGAAAPGAARTDAGATSARTPAETPRPAAAPVPPQAAAPAPRPPSGPKAAPAPETAQGIVVSSPYEQQLEPRSPAGAMTLAGWVHNSRLYARFPSQEAIFAVIVRGREMGLGALTSLDCFHVVEGKPVTHAHLIIARAKAHPDCEYFQMTACTATSVTYETKNRNNPKPTSLTYSLSDAQNAGLCPITMRTTPVRNDKGKDIRGNWEKRPAEMMRKTCGVQLARVEYPDAAMGLYSIEELGDE